MGAIRKLRTAPTLVSVGNKQVSSSGRWNDALMAQYVMEHGRKKWLDIRELARVAYLSASPANQTRVRQCLHKLFTHLMKQHAEILAVEYNGKNRSASAVKLYDGKTEAERQAATIKLDRMKLRGEIAAEQYTQALELLKAQEQATQAIPDQNENRI